MAKKAEIRFSATMDVENLVRSLADVKKRMEGVKMPADVAKNLNIALNEAEYSIKELKKAGEKPIMTRSALKQFNNAYKQAADDYKNVFRYINKLQDTSGKFSPKESLGKQYKYYQLIEQAINKINASKKKDTKAYQEANANLDKQKEQLKQIKELQTKINKANEAYIDAIGAQNEAIKKHDDAIANREDSDTKGKLKSKMLRAIEAAEEAEAKVDGLKEELANSNLAEEGETAAQAMMRLKNQVEEAQKAVDNITNGTAGFNEQLEELKKTAADNSGFAEFLNTQELTGLGDGLESIKNLEDLKNVLESVRQNSEELAQIDFHETTTGLAMMERDLSNIDTAADNTNTQVKELLETTEDFGKVGQRALDFFALSNLGNIFGQIVQDARQAVTELDEVMTATAVVTDFSVGDMWDKLPEYTKVANELGASTLGAYETTTLFYQQGMIKI